MSGFSRTPVSFSAKAVATFTPGLEYSLEVNRLHYDAGVNRAHYSTDENRLHYRVKEKE